MELHFRSISDVARMLRAGETTSIIVTEHMLRRIEHHNDMLNAFITVTADLARAQARRADEELARGKDRGVLHGIPVAVKDLFSTKGIRTTAGSKLFEHFVPDFDATAVEKLRDAGAVLLGKTSLYELASGTTGLNPYFGQIENPWKAGFDPGGSSGGSAAAVAAGLAFAALGTDTGCSVREPAHCCGIVGFKPTFGLVSKAGVQPLVWSKDHVGPLTRNVKDAAAVFDAISGYDGKDPYSKSIPPNKQKPVLPGSLSEIRVGVIRRFFFECDQEIDGAINNALKKLDERGATIVELDMPDLEEAFSSGRLNFAEAAAIHEQNLHDFPECFSDTVRATLTASLKTDLGQLIRAQKFRVGFTTRMEILMAGIDILVAPTSRRLAADLSDLPSDYRHLVWKNTSIFNLTGQPSISIPCEKSNDGLPIGLMMSSALFEDERLLHIAHLAEAAINFPDPHPPI